MADVRLFCFPYAGASGTIYRSWPEHLPRSVEVYSIQLPGRGSRIREHFYTRIEPLVSDLRQAIEPYLDRPSAFFGHSLGALIAFELARILVRDGLPSPLHLFLSGCPNPLYYGPITYNLADAEFKRYLQDLNGISPELLANNEAMKYFLPILRADLEIVDTYKYLPGSLIECSMTALGGTRDWQVPIETLGAWRDYTLGPFNLKLFVGDHFFLHTCQVDLLRMISDRVLA